MAYTQQAAGTNVALYDTTPFLALTDGEGAPSRLKTVEDQVAIARTGAGTQHNFWRLCRFPADARVKKVELFVDLASGTVDGGGASSALVFEVGVIFSDSTIDGTPANYQNLQPTTVGVTANGGSTTAGTAVAIGGTSANWIFGTITANTTTGAFGAKIGDGPVFGEEITFGGVGTTYGAPLYITQTPLTEIFNFVDGSGNVLDGLGYFDLIVDTKTVYNTQPSAGYNLYGRVSYTA
jgi:hypothetical protein